MFLGNLELHIHLPNVELLGHSLSGGRSNKGRNFWYAADKEGALVTNIQGPRQVSMLKWVFPGPCACSRGAEQKCAQRRIKSVEFHDSLRLMGSFEVSYSGPLEITRIPGKRHFLFFHAKERRELPLEAKR